MRNRLMVHDNVKALHQHVERKCLPKEYGGDIPMSDMIGEYDFKKLALFFKVFYDGKGTSSRKILKTNLFFLVAWQKELSSHRQTIISLDNMKSLIPIRRRNQNPQIEEMRGSFKKLQFD